MKKKILVFLLTAAILGGGGAGGYAGYKNYRDKHTEAEVWSVASLDWGYWGSDMECSGVLTIDVAQQIYLNSEQQVEEVYVEEGQTVSVGDPLLKYDETSIQYEIQMKELDIETIQNNTAIAERALNRLQNMDADRGKAGRTMDRGGYRRGNDSRCDAGGRPGGLAFSAAGGQSAVRKSE